MARLCAVWSEVACRFYFPRCHCAHARTLKSRKSSPEPNANCFSFATTRRCFRGNDGGTAAPSRAAEVSDGLKTINNPGGGQVVYGPLDDVKSMRDAMATMLKNVHGHFGEKPQIGKFFHARNSDSVATFFNVTATKQGGKRIAGQVIVSMPTGVAPAAAVLYDDESRFGKTEPALMKKLSEAWQKDMPKPVLSSSGESGGMSGIFGTSWGRFMPGRKPTTR